MRHYTRTRALLVATVAILGFAVWYTGQSQRTVAEDAAAETRATERVLAAVFETDVAIGSYLQETDLARLAPLQTIQASLADLKALVEDGAERELYEKLALRAGRVEFLAGQAVLAVQRGEPARAASLHEEIHGALVEYRAAHEALTAAIQEQLETGQKRAGLVPIGAIVLLGLVGAAVAIATERSARAERARRLRDAELTETLQAAQSEDEAYRILGRHIERATPGARAVVLNRNHSDDRLEARTEVPADSPLAATLEQAKPDSCLAVRLAKPHRRDPDREQLMPCELCGGSAARSTCVPALVGGHVIGSVLVEHEQQLDSLQAADVERTVAAAAPVVANLRTLQLAEARAATDALTGLANSRAIRETAKRMVAQAVRSGRPLAAILFDLDHFKEVNDRHGHEQGDEVLAAVGTAVAAAVRGGDYVGRYGGEEFVALLPDTDRGGALVVAEKVREAVARIRTGDLERPITASFGVAALFEDAEDAAELLRAADRAMYRAKRLGRNRVETLGREDDSSPPPSLSIAAS